jgi:Ca-activated chloride channel family protein
MRFAHSWVLLLLLLVPALAWAWRRFAARRRATLRFSDVTHLKHTPRARGRRLAAVVPALRLAVLSLLLVGLARPQTGWRDKEMTAEGIDIMLLLDVSKSMSTEDFEPTRLDAAKAVIKQFVEGRRNDRIGAVIFGVESFNLCPLTLDYGVLKQFLERVRDGIIDSSRTAIGMGLAAAVQQLNDSKAKSKVIILLTDGANNSGEIDPFTAADMAKALGIKVYTIGIGRVGELTVMGPFGPQRVRSDYDEGTLREIAKRTGGQFFHADNERKLADIYRQIDRMEKSEIKTKEYQYFDEQMEWAVAPALLLLLLEIALGYTRLRKLP